MEDFLGTFEKAFTTLFQSQPGTFREPEFVSVGTKLEPFLFMNNSKLKELFAIFAPDNQVL
jgi:hypothetical protein